MVNNQDNRPDVSPELIDEALEWHKVIEKTVAVRSDKLVQIARTDELTGLPNRRALEEHLIEMVNLANRRILNAPLFCIFIDVDGFKQVNDTFGHKKGDQVLRKLAAEIEIRETDFLARYGGDEFVMTSITSNFFPIVNRLNEAFRKVAKAHEVDITPSIGIAEYSSNLQSPDFLHKADELMYQAKKAGKNRVAYLDDGKAVIKKLPLK